MGTLKENKIVSDLLCFVKKHSFYISLLSFLVVPILVFYLRGVGAMIATPLFIVFLLEIKRYLPKTMGEIIILTGVYSIFMWLTHSFYIYYFAAPYIYIWRKIYCIDFY